MDEKEAILRWYLAIVNAQVYYGTCDFCKRPLLGLQQYRHPFCNVLVQWDLGERL